MCINKMTVETKACNAQDHCDSKKQNQVQQLLLREKGMTIEAAIKKSSENTE